MAQSLFRSIRMKLLDEGKLLRYLTYAIGEVILIIVGIMIALQLNNWNEDRKAQVEFDEYIVQLREDVKGAIESTKHSVGLNERFRSECEIVLTFLELSDYGKEELAAFETGLTRLGVANQIYVYIGVLGELMNGHMEIIGRDPGLTMQAQMMVTKVGRRLANIDLIQNKLTLASDRLIQFRSRGDNSDGKPPRYNLDNLKSSDEFIYTADTIISEIGNVIFHAEDIIRVFEEYLAVLEEYE